MNDWKQESLRDICTLISRGVSPKYVESGTVILNQKCIRDNRINYSECKYTSSEKKVSEEKYLQELDILVNSTGTGTLGRTAQIKSLNQDTLVDTHITIVRADNNIVDPVFIAYQISLKEPEIVSLGKGATNQQELGRDELGSIIINLPPLPTQKRIASILSAYDDLIENNLKRIKLLEEVAQRTYEEWFVKFRVNGEHLPMDEETGLPVGWNKVRLNDIYKIKYGKNLPQTQIKESGEYPVYGASGKMGFFSKFNCLNKVVLITSRGNGSGDIHRTFENQTFVTNNSFVVSPEKGFEYLSVPYSMNLLKTINLKGYCSGSAQPQLTNASMDNIFVQLPNMELIGDFNLIVLDSMEMADNLREQNQKLKQSRDILLPRLMSGTINVT